MPAKIQELVQNFPQFQGKKSALYRSKLTTTPLLPKSLDELFINGDYSLTELGERFLLKDIKNSDERIIIFASNNGLKTLARSQRWHSDGTFRSAPTLFTQNYIIHGLFKGK
jgi:hypothetical protein